MVSKITKLSKKRADIFKKFSSQLEILKQSNLLLGYNPKYIDNYICPICLKHFSQKDLNQELANPLTLEDAPQKSLGGEANTLTCKKCNNTLGTKVDSHLHYRLNEIDKKRFLPNTEAMVKVKMGEEVVQGTVQVDKNGQITILHSPKNNHKEKLEEFIKRIDPKAKNPIVEIEFPTGKADLNRAQYALLKTAYLLTFERFGYLFILDKAYDKIREQLLNPDDELYPTKFWFELPHPKELCGVYFITENRMESIFVVFPLKTDNTERIIAAILPLPFNSIAAIIKELNIRFSEDKKFRVSCSDFDPKADYFSEIEHIKHTSDWIEMKKKNTSKT